MKTLAPFHLSLLAWIASLLLGTSLLYADDQPLSVQIIPQYESVRPGEKVELLLRLQLACGWHINADAAQVKEVDGLAPIPTQVSVGNLDATANVIYPPAQAMRVSFADSPVMLFTDGQVIRLSLATSGKSNPHQAARQPEVTISYQACDDQTCRPPTKLTLTIPIRLSRDANPTPSAEYQALAATLPAIGQNVSFDLFGHRLAIDLSDSLGFVLLLMTAAVGGLLLNMTPCVLPVLPLKVMALAQAGENRRKTLLLGVMMSLGVVGFWLLLGLLIGTATGLTSTNELFRYPAFTISVGLVIAIMAVGMCGLFSLQPPMWVYRWSPRHDTMPGAVGFGVMTAILSTPCTAPFMGAAAAWSATQPVTVTLLVFASIGLGMAIPYLILSAWPNLARRMPRTGPASLIIKETMGLLMLAAAAYFAGSGISALLTPVGQPVARGHWWVVMAVVAVAVGWCVWRTARLLRRFIAKTTAISVGLLLIALCFWSGSRLTDRGPIHWVYYTDSTWKQAQESGRPILLDFTAEWCLNCKALESAVLHSPRVVQAIKQNHLLPIKVDLTRQDEQASDLLKQHGRITIPWLVILSPDGQTIYASEAYTVESVTQAIAQASAGEKQSR